MLPRQTAARMALQCKLQLVVSDDAQQVSVGELVMPGTRTLNGDLAATFRRWYPAWSLDDQPGHDTLLAA